MYKKDERLDELTNQILNPGEFSYDYESDPLYQNYLKSYTQQGKTAMNDTLAQVSSRTGGLASTYATQAAQGTYDNYLKQAADKIPELYQLRYNEWQDKQNNLLNQYNLLNNADSTNYSRYRDDLSDKLTAENTAYNQNLTKAGTLSNYGDFSGYKALGYSDEEIANMQNKYNSDLAKENTATYQDKLLSIAQNTGNGDDYAAYYKSLGYSDTQVDNALNNLGYEKDSTANYVGITGATKRQGDYDEAVRKGYTGTFSDYLSDINKVGNYTLKATDTSYTYSSDIQAAAKDAYDRLYDPSTKIGNETAARNAAISVIVDSTDYQGAIKQIRAFFGCTGAEAEQMLSDFIG